MKFASDRKLTVTAFFSWNAPIMSGSFDCSVSDDRREPDCCSARSVLPTVGTRLTADS